ncbi:MAG: hypothetical protein AAFQ80_23725 [Cyanobacteria bacterium J06621_8]
MKYFFLSEGWTCGRVWEFGGLWDHVSWGRKPDIKRLDCGVLQHQEVLWLYAVEDAVLMVEVEPREKLSLTSSIGQVVLKRLISGDQAIKLLTQSELIFNSVSQAQQHLSASKL